MQGSAGPLEPSILFTKHSKTQWLVNIGEQLFMAWNQLVVEFENDGTQIGHTLTIMVDSVL